MKRAFGIAALGAVCAGPALADVTPQQVWDNLSGTMRTYGYTVDSRQEAQGSDLRVTDIVMSGPLSGAGEDEMSGAHTITLRATASSAAGSARQDSAASVPLLLQAQ